jgi:hypothetical protein
VVAAVHLSGVKKMQIPFLSGKSEAININTVTSRLQSLTLRAFLESALSPSFFICGRGRHVESYMGAVKAFMEETVGLGIEEMLA